MKKIAYLMGDDYFVDRYKCNFGGGGGGQPTSTTTNKEIPAELKPLAAAYTDKAINLSQQSFNPYTAQRYEDLNATQNAGIGKVQNRAINGSATMGNAEGNLNQFISGGQTNPYLDSLVSKAQGSVVEQFNNMTKPQTEAAMRNSGSFGNSGYDQLMQNQQKAAGEQLGDIATQMYGQAYEGDQSKRIQAIGMAPTFGNAAYQDASQLLNAGQIQQDQKQQGLDFNYQQFQDAENLPYKQLAGMSGVFGSNLGGSSKSTSNGGGCGK